MLTLRQIAPKSLYGRTILIVVLPIFLMQTIVTWVFFDRHWEEVNARLAKGAAAELGHVTALYNDAAPAERAQVLTRASDELEIAAAFVPGAALPDRSRPARFDPFDRVLNRELDWHLDAPYWYDASGEGVVEVRVARGDGVLAYQIRRDRVLATNGPFFVLWLLLTTVLLGYVAVVFLRNQVRSITRLADAAEAFGRGREAPAFKPAGAREVRQAGHAFLAMRARLRRYVRQRTEMLAGVSHDLRTPLTRMKLNLALQPDSEDVAELRADVEEMERMVEDYLTFASDEDEAGVEAVDLAAMLGEVADGARRMGRDVELAVRAGFTVEARPVALRRAVGNLVGNALRHGQRVRVCAEVTDAEVRIHVDDDGPGIPAARREEAMRAFTRLDPARTDAEGTGLGLAIVRDFARRHGGRLTLSDSPLGGLRATIGLPC